MRWAGGAVDYSALLRQKSQIQNVADSAALAVGRQMTIMQMSDTQMQATAQKFASANAKQLGLDHIAVIATPTTDRLGVRVEAAARAKVPFGISDLLAGSQTLSASATARVGQETKLCLLSISQTKTDNAQTKLFMSREPVGIDIGTGARLTAPGCLLQSNISTKTAISIGAGAQLKASVICSVGGVQNTGGLVDAAVVDGCPSMPNPIEQRVSLNVSQNCVGVAYKDFVYSGGDHVLTPGTYCGNIRIERNAKVRMSPGVYTIQGRLLVSGNAELHGERVGIYLWGGDENGALRHAYFRFTENALINLSAPETGDMAGFLIWENINGATRDQKNDTKEGYNYHQINTSRARRLNGTIYLPGGRLLIDAPVRVAEESDYTVLLVNRLDLRDGPNLVLNANYVKSRVPVPQGLGPLGAKNVRLEK